MYRRQVPGQVSFKLPFNTVLNPNSEWVLLADIIPWDRIEEEYQRHFSENEGKIAKSSRLAFGALYIQMEEGFTDEKTRQHIQENPHLQYFCGLPCYTVESPFDASMMTWFRRRIPAEMIMEIKEFVLSQKLNNMMFPKVKGRRLLSKKDKDFKTQ